MNMSLSTALFAATASLAVASVAGAADIYKWVDAEGVTHYSQMPPTGASPDLETVQIDASNPEDWSPQDYEHSILNQVRRTDERLAAAAEAQREGDERAGVSAPPAFNAPPYYYPPDRYAYYPPIIQPIVIRPLRKTHRKPGLRRPAHRFDWGDRFAHPARSHRRLGADKRFGYLAHRITHRQPRAALREE